MREIERRSSGGGVFGRRGFVEGTLLGWVAILVARATHLELPYLRFLVFDTSALSLSIYTSICVGVYIYTMKYPIILNIFYKF